MNALKSIAVLLACALGPLGCSSGSVPSEPVTIAGDVIATGLEGPLHLSAPPNDSSRVFVVEQSGIVRVINLGARGDVPGQFLDISSRVAVNGEGGLLAIAFHPDYASNGYFFLSYTADIDPGMGFQFGSRVSRFQVTSNPDVADPLSETVFLEVLQPAGNHNGGGLSFKHGDSTHALYFSLGDGGFQCDAVGGGQDPTDKLASILRIDVDSGPGPDLNTPNVPADNPFVGITGDDSVWVYGLRNPYRFSFDRETGDLYIGDVGGNASEEISFQDADSAGGENYGWPAIEGTISPPTNCSGTPPVTPEMVPPIHEYLHEGAGEAVIGGYVYRGSMYPTLRGRYFFADFITGRVWSFVRLGGTVEDLLEHTEEINPSRMNVTSFGEDANGELYMLQIDGTVLRVRDGA